MNTHELARELLEAPDKEITISVDLDNDLTSGNKVFADPLHWQDNGNNVTLICENALPNFEETVIFWNDTKKKPFIGAIVLVKLDNGNTFQAIYTKDPSDKRKRYFYSYNKNRQIDNGIMYDIEYFNTIQWTYFETNDFIEISPNISMKTDKKELRVEGVPSTLCHKICDECKSRLYKENSIREDKQYYWCLKCDENKLGYEVT